MSEYESQIREKEALFELRQYVSDNVAPLMFADSASWLIERDPEAVANLVRSWAGSQMSRGGSALTADYLYHAVKKIYMLGDLNLLPQESLIRYLQRLAQLLLEGCPPGEREALRESLSRLGDAEDILAAPVEFIHRSGAAATQASRPDQQSAAQNHAARPDYSKEISDVLGRFDLLLSRIEEKGRGPSGSRRDDGGEEGGSLTAHALALAAESAQSSADLQRYLGRLGVSASSAGDQSVIRTLGDNLPDWAVAFAPSAENAAAGGSNNPGRSDSLLGAMQRMVSLAEDQPERAARFGEVVENAVRQFNEDHLGRAVSMIDVARELIAKRQVEEAIWRPVRQNGHGEIDQKKLRAAADDRDRHLLLRRFINFFDRLTVDGLLEDLRVERARDRRRMKITLLECYGAEARPVVLRALEATVSDPDQQENWYFRRNLLYLLHSIPLAPGEIHSDKEISAFIDFSALGHPVQVIREALSNLALTEPQRAERMLQVRLREYEQALMSNQRDQFNQGELRSLLDRAMSVLIRTPTPGAQRAAVEHGLREHEALGEAHERLVELGELDLANNEFVVERLLQALGKELPNRVLGLFARKTDNPRAANIVRALGGTAASHQTARATLESVAEKYALTDFGRVAEEVLKKRDGQPQSEREAPAPPSSLDVVDEEAALVASIDAADPLGPPPSAAPPPPAPAKTTAAPAGTLNGDLSLFGLPNLMQNLADSRLSGNLKLLDQDGGTVGIIALEEGRILSSSAGHLQGVEAIYQLLERPFPGTFQFSRRSAEEAAEAGEATDDSLDLISVLLEGMRRYDELLMSSEVIPDDAQITPTGVEPTTPEDETDMSLVQKVWALISVGTTPADCETKVTCDSYRVRRLLSHWLENKAIRLSPAAS